LRSGKISFNNYVAKPEKNGICIHKKRGLRPLFLIIYLQHYF